MRIHQSLTYLFFKVSKMMAPMTTSPPRPPAPHGTSSSTTNGVSCGTAGAGAFLLGSSSGRPKQRERTLHGSHQSQRKGGIMLIRTIVVVGTISCLLVSFFGFTAYVQLDSIDDVLAPDQPLLATRTDSRSKKKSTSSSSRQKQQQQQQQNATATSIIGAKAAVRTNGRGGEKTMDGGNGIGKREERAIAISASASNLFPTPLRILKHSMLGEGKVPMDQMIVYPNRKFDKGVDGDLNCNCLNPKANMICCGRHYRVAYKMKHNNLPSVDYFVQQQEKAKKAKLIGNDDNPLDKYYLETLPWRDYRDVIFLQNIYNVLVKGYVAHTEQKECKKGLWRKQMKLGKRNAAKDPAVANWKPTYELQPPKDGRNLCEYVRDEPAEIGMRAYIDWVFHSQYSVHFAHFALSRGIPEIRDRTMVVCRDWIDPESEIADKTMQQIQNFMYNNNSTKKRTGMTNYWKAAARRENYFRPGQLSSMMQGVQKRKKHFRNPGRSLIEDNRIRELERIINVVDKKYFNGDIAWLASIIPC